jgi:hypothetical protein
LYLKERDGYLNCHDSWCVHPYCNSQQHKRGKRAKNSDVQKTATEIDKEENLKKKLARYFPDSLPNGTI